MNQIDTGIKLHIERLINYAIKKQLIYEDDIIVVRNYLLDYFKLQEPYEAVYSEDGNLCHVSEILETLLDLAYEKGLFNDNSLTARDLESAKIMGFVTPRQSEVVKTFNELYNIAPTEATEYFYELSKNSDYIKTYRTGQNICWTSDTPYGKLEITINLSKPEKDPKEIAAAKSAPAGSYPKCLLCAENAGYAGRYNHPARQNHRIIPVTLGGEKWYLQYSPYLYYNEHSIVLNEKHVPMKISDRTFVLLIDFIEKFPHYFIGSNADLPIVGGSILSHDHFQGGRYKFPIEYAKDAKSFYYNKHKACISVIKWPLSTIRINGSKSEVISIAAHILNMWREYSDEDEGIIAYGKDERGNKVPHNTVTPIARKSGNGFELDIVLRNNRTDDDHPLGIFHPHNDVHHIKKENIGLIEVMGLAILPPRLKDEVIIIEEVLTGKRKNEAKGIGGKHYKWAEYLIEKYGVNNSEKDANNIIKKEIGVKFCKVLEDAGVYKKTRLKSFYKFMKHCGFKEMM